jgi:signal peptidase I
VGLHQDELEAVKADSDWAYAVDDRDEYSRGSQWEAIREIVETILLAVVIWLVVNFATARFVVDGSSMEPNMHTGQFLIVSKIAYRLDTPRRGDVIVFHYPNNPSEDYIKRVIGLPGDTVTIERGTVYVNGVRLDEPYVTMAQQFSGRHASGAWAVEEGQLFVLGDNRAGSSDSRDWGVLDEDYVIGKAWISYWPPQEWGIVPHYEYGETP